MNLTLYNVPKYSSYSVSIRKRHVCLLLWSAKTFSRIWYGHAGTQKGVDGRMRIQIDANRYRYNTWGSKQYEEVQKYRKACFGCDVMIQNNRGLTEMVTLAINDQLEKFGEMICQDKSLKTCKSSKNQQIAQSIRMQTVLTPKQIKTTGK